MAWSWNWATDGITDAVARTTGPECMDYMTNRRRLIESVVLTILAALALKRVCKRLEPIHIPPNADNPNTVLRNVLLISMTFIFGMELGFKFAEKTVIFALNPCHLQTVVQMYLLVAQPSKLSTAIFRIQMNYLNGPLLAFLFPEIETRTLNLEQFTYWTQHALLFIIPIYLLMTGRYEPERINNFKWNVIGMSTMVFYHFTFLSYVSTRSGININHMLCAATSDPFQGSNYRIAACIHESILCPVLNKMFTFLFYTFKDEAVVMTNEPIYIDRRMYKRSRSRCSSRSSTPRRMIEEPIMTTKID